MQSIAFFEFMSVFNFSPEWDRIYIVTEGKHKQVNPSKTDEIANR